MRGHVGGILVDDAGNEIRVRDGALRVRRRRLHNGRLLFCVQKSTVDGSLVSALGLLLACPGCDRPWYMRPPGEEDVLKPHEEKRQIWNRCSKCFREIERERMRRRRAEQWKVWSKKDPDTWWTIEHFQRGRKSRWKILK